MPSNLKKSKSKTVIMNKRYEDIEFDFLNLDEAATYTGTVIVREHAMVLDIPAQDDLPACLIEGHLRGHIYSGVNSIRHKETSSINAKWTDLGDIFIGVWIEDGYEYVFTFRLASHA